MNGAEPEGDDEGGAPEADSTRFGLVGKETGNAGEATGQSVLQIAAEEVFLEEPNGNKTGNPEEGVAKGFRAEEQTSIDDQQSGFKENEDEYRDGKQSEDNANKKAGGFLSAAEAVDIHGTSLDLRHDPGDKNDREKGSHLGEENGQRAGLMPHDVRRDEVRGSQKKVEKEDEGEEQQDSDQQTPSGAETVWTEEDARRRGWSGEVFSFGGGLRQKRLPL